jgi:hypothetical protein
MKKFIAVVIILGIATLVYSRREVLLSDASFLKSMGRGGIGPVQAAEAMQSALPFKAGEGIVFDFFLFKVKSGRTDVVFLGKADCDGKEAYLIESSTRALNYDGTEKIFTETAQFFPLKVERNLRLGFTQEDNVELYDPLQHSVVIKRKKNGKDLKDIDIKSEAPLQNVISLLYHLRLKKDIAVGQVIPVNLPRTKLELVVQEVQEVKVPYGRYPAFLLEDRRGDLSIWLSEKERLPLLVRYSSGMKQYTMKMRQLVAP